MNKGIPKGNGSCPALWQPDYWKRGPKDWHFLGSLMLEEGKDWPCYQPDTCLQTCTHDNRLSHFTRPPELRQGWITRGGTASLTSMALFYFYIQRSLSLNLHFLSVPWRCEDGLEDHWTPLFLPLQHGPTECLSFLGLPLLPISLLAFWGSYLAPNGYWDRHLYPNNPVTWDLVKKLNLTFDLLCNPGYQQTHKTPGPGSQVLGRRPDRTFQFWKDSEKTRYILGENIQKLCVL